MKRRYAYSKNSKEYFWKQKSIKNNFFDGEVCYLKFINIQNPLVVKNELSTITIRDNGYEWLELYPNNGNYVITIMFDNKHNLLEWYFDISKKVSMEDGIPYEDDLYLDYVIYPDGRDVVVDGDELQEACDNKNE